MTRHLRWLLILVAAIIVVAGCGKRGEPIPPSGEESTFPQAYPQR